ncbi:CAP domain-containing protein [Chryseomicrobium aureum]|uniref:CAP domain-containing protein n=1 Tax=Chryseomicrobium aureum TaxID=1441723 RepID=UPI003599E97D
MNNLAKLFIAAVIVVFAFVLFDQPVQENELLTEERQTGQVLPQENLTDSTPDYNVFSRPKEGVSTFVGKPIEEWRKAYGDPLRIEPSLYNYEWHIYKHDVISYQMVGVEDGIINQVYAAGEDAQVNPYKVGQSLEEIYRFTLVLPEIGLELNDSTYVLSLSPSDTQRRILVQYEGLFAQLYIDTFDNQLEGVRFITPEVLLMHRAYDTYYEGEMVETTYPTSAIQNAVDRAAERELFDLTNLYRMRHGVEALNTYPALAQIAREYSQELAKSETVMQEEFELSKYEDKLEEFEIPFKRAGGNSAALYRDPIEAINGWINSKVHRETILEPTYTHLGVGVFSEYYTQNFIEIAQEESE